MIGTYIVEVTRCTKRFLLAFWFLIVAVQYEGLSNVFRISLNQQTNRADVRMREAKGVLCVTTRR